MKLRGFVRGDNLGSIQLLVLQNSLHLTTYSDFCPKFYVKSGSHNVINRLVNIHVLHSPTLKLKYHCTLLNYLINISGGTH